ncbi:MAG: hypothetical protein E7391_04785 [Ruminococcaceae bacterium]|nr:hypothetical protein [Oscillospiraceae bacterium]
MDFKRIGKHLLFPHIAIMVLLIPFATVFLVYSMINFSSDSVAAIISYVIAFYTLMVWCIKLPQLIKFFKTVKNENKYAKIWQEDTRLRVKVSLYGTLVFNSAYAVFQFGLGYFHHTFWYYSLALYYALLAVMRFFLLRHTKKHIPGTQMKKELIKYRACGIIFLIMNLALTTIIFFMVYWNRTFVHHKITTIAMAAYTFTSLVVAIINTVRYQKYNSPVYSASKAISLASACVSILTLEATMLTTFDDGTMSIVTRRIFLATSGGAISVFIIAMAVYMIIQSNKKLKLIKESKEFLR